LENKPFILHSRPRCQLPWQKNIESIATPLAPVVQKVDNAIHRINYYPLDIAIGFAITYPVDSDLSGG